MSPSGIYGINNDRLGFIPSSLYVCMYLIACFATQKRIHWLVFFSMLVFKSAGHLWSGRFDGGNNDFITSGAIGLDGRVAVTGYYWSTTLMVYDGKQRISAELPAAQQSGCFVTVLTSNGQHIWSLTLDGTASDYCMSVSIDNAGRIAVAGYFGSQVISIKDAMGNTLGSIQQSTSSYASIVLLIASNSYPLWSARFEGHSDQFVQSVAFDENGRVAVGGYFSSSSMSIIDGSSQPITPQLANSGIGAYCAFVSVFFSNGSHSWSATFDGTGSEYARSIKFDSSGRLGVIGSYQSSVMSIRDRFGNLMGGLDGSNSFKGFLSLISSQGSHLWSARFDGSNVYDVAFDRNQRVMVVGVYTESTLAIYNSSGRVVATFSKAGNSAGFLSIFSTASGSFEWAVRIDGSGSENIASVAYGKNGSISVVGDFSSPSLQIYDRRDNLVATVPRLGTQCGFLIAYSQNGTHLWSTRFDGDREYYALSVAIDRFDRVAVAGQYKYASLSVFDRTNQVVASFPVNGSMGSWISLFNIDGTNVSPFIEEEIGTRSTISAFSQYTATPSSMIDPAKSQTSISTPSGNIDATKEASATESMVIIWTVAGSLAASAVLVVSIFLVRREKRERKTDLTTHGKTTYDSENSSLMTSPTFSTLIPTQHELSVPAFAEMLWGVEFRQEDFIAKGGGGSLFKCTPLSFALSERTKNDQLVVKHIGEDLDHMSDRFKQSFLQELSMMWVFRDHPNFCKVYGFSVRPVCIVMKCYTLGDLDGWISYRSRKLDKFPYTKRSVIKMFREYTSAIEYMHRRGYAHCDIKPANVLLDHDYLGKLSPIVTDFGVSCVFNSSDAQKIDAFIASDVRGASIQFAGPEVFVRFRSHALSTDADLIKGGDLYALSMTLLNMLTRSAPWSK